MTTKTAPILLLIRGLPGSGKTTLAKSFGKAGFLHYEADHHFERPDGSYVFRREELPDAHARCLAGASHALSSGLCAVVSNTFTRLWEMQPYIDTAKKLGAVVVVLTTHGSWPNSHGVPPEVIERMRERWEPTPPMLTLIQPEAFRPSASGTEARAWLAGE